MNCIVVFRFGRFTFWWYAVEWNKARALPCLHTQTLCCAGPLSLTVGKKNCAAPGHCIPTGGGRATEKPPRKCNSQPALCQLSSLLWGDDGWRRSSFTCAHRAMLGAENIDTPASQTGGTHGTKKGSSMSSSVRRLLFGTGLIFGTIFVCAHHYVAPAVGCMGMSPPPHWTRIRTIKHRQAYMCSTPHRTAPGTSLSVGASPYISIKKKTETA